MLRLFLFLVVLGALGGAGWYFCPPETKEAIQAQIAKLTENFGSDPAPTLSTTQPTSTYAIKFELEPTHLKWATIDHDEFNDQPDKLLFITPDHLSKGPNNHFPLGVWFSEGRWRIFNQIQQDLSEGLRLNVLAMPPGPNAFVHQAKEFNYGEEGTHITKLDHPALNGKPDVRPLVTQRWESVYNPHHIGVYYYDGIWTIYNKDKEPIPEDALFNVYVNDEAHLIDATSPTQNSFEIDHTKFNGNPDRLIFITQRWNSPLYNPHLVGAQFIDQKWRIVNQDLADLNEGLSFHVLCVASPAAIVKQGSLDENDSNFGEGEYYEEYTFNGTRGQKATIDLSSDDFDTYLMVFRPEGEKLDNDDRVKPDNNSLLELDLVEDGEYRVTVTSNEPGETGGYELKISSDNSSTQPRVERGSLTEDDSGTTDGSYMDNYTFNGSKGERITFDLKSSEFDTWLVVYFPDGDKKQNDDRVERDKNSLLELDLIDGEYKVRVTSNKPGETGDYELNISFDK